MTEFDGEIGAARLRNDNQRQFLSNCLTALAINPRMGVRELCDSLSISRATFYRHVGSFEDLITELTDDAFVALRNAVGFQNRSSKEAGLAEAFDACVDCHCKSVFLFHRALIGGELSGALANVLKPFIDVSRRNEEIDPSIPSSWIVLSFGSTLLFLCESDNVARDAILARRFLFQGFAAE